MLERYRADLAGLAGRDRLRALAPRAGLDFASNDYLALAESRALAEAAAAALARSVPVGAGGSRLLRGNHPEHEALEEEAARFFHAESALFFGAGFSANEALLSTLPQRDDCIFYDALIHASAHDGMGLSRASRAPFLHNDVNALEAAILDWRRKGGTGRAWIAVESLYSMDGDLAPLDALMSLSERHQAFVLVDEAHATGVFGEGGRGLAARFEGRENVITVHTCGKALGVSGALICLAAPLRDFLVNRCRNFIFATAPSPLVAACVRASLKIVEKAEDRRAALRARVALAGRDLQKLCNVAPSGSQVQPVIVGADARAMTLAARMRARGYDIRAIRPPTVPEGTARLRLSLTLHASEAQISQMVAELAEELKAQE
ncbi:8-amino-7-oxononanoate synthase [Methylocystis parvus]|uniref:8-amino-7-oxononanoate synthase n=1 Tax=Methylocystis parvus TaxID=134 RepID=A0A6B8M6W5_9HYPH|nr:8-amino-7-oxononanoate synthase [Methylocystis parvus]QGM96560.1 8-amino-7-oxononanoate synthase [Methylocystis parvus]WBJ99588.1 8-amino-7-oxononanoate synthase [Methylocystis parvus OBBP]